MKVKEIQKILKTLKGPKYKVTLDDIGEALGTSGANISQRSKKDSELTTTEIEKIEKHFNVKLIDYRPGISSKVKEVVNYLVSDDITKYNRGLNKFKEKNNIAMPDSEKYIVKSDVDCINVEYIGICPSCGDGTMIFDEPEITPIKLSNSLITQILKCTQPENLKVFKAQGDSMETLIEDGDLLLVDVGRTDVYNAGIYVFSVDSEWRCKRFNVKLDKTLEIISDNPKYGIEKFKPGEIEIKIRGKVIKNLSRGL